MSLSHPLQFQQRGACGRWYTSSLKALGPGRLPPTPVDLPRSLVLFPNEETGQVSHTHGSPMAPALHRCSIKICSLIGMNETHAVHLRTQCYFSLESSRSSLSFPSLLSMQPTPLASAGGLLPGPGGPSSISQAHSSSASLSRPFHAPGMCFRAFEGRRLQEGVLPEGLYEPLHLLGFPLNTDVSLELTQGLVQLRAGEVHLVHHAAEGRWEEGHEGRLAPKLPPTHWS